MSMRDKVLIGGPALVGTIAIVVSKVLPILGVLGALVLALFLGKVMEEGTLRNALQAGIALSALGGYLFRQYTTYKNKRIHFLMKLADNLYFKNLDNNAGVFHHLIDAAEEEECKEALLAYYFLLTHGPQTQPALDDLIENWFDQQHETQIDFEVDDALNKLAEMQLGSADDQGVWSVLPLEKACARVDYIWDNYFQFNQGGDDDQSEPQPTHA
jgi:hypothetical protein